MAYVINWSASISWVGDGVGPFTQGGAPVLTGNTLYGGNGGPVQVPGGDSPSSGNLTTAATSVGTAVNTFLQANIGQIQGWATGTTQ